MCMVKNLLTLYKPRERTQAIKRLGPWAREWLNQAGRLSIKDDILYHLPNPDNLSEAWFCVPRSVIYELCEQAHRGHGGVQQIYGKLNQCYCLVRHALVSLSHRQNIDPLSSFPSYLRGRTRGRKLQLWSPKKKFCSVCPLEYYKHSSVTYYLREKKISIWMLNLANSYLITYAIFLKWLKKKNIYIIFDDKFGYLS